MATIDELLNDIDEFENWPLDDNVGAALTPRSTDDAGTVTADRDLLERVLRYDLR